MHLAVRNALSFLQLRHHRSPRYKEVVEAVFKYKDSKEKLIRRAVITLLPRLAAFSPERFAMGTWSTSCFGACAPASWADVVTGLTAHELAVQMDRPFITYTHH